MVNIVRRFRIYDESVSHGHFGSVMVLPVEDLLQMVVFFPLVMMAYSRKKLTLRSNTSILGGMRSVVCAATLTWLLIFPTEAFVLLIFASLYALSDHFIDVYYAFANWQYAIMLRKERVVNFVGALAHE